MIRQEVQIIAVCCLQRFHPVCWSVWWNREAGWLPFGVFPKWVSSRSSALRGGRLGF